MSKTRKLDPRTWSFGDVVRLRRHGTPHVIFIEHGKTRGTFLGTVIKSDGTANKVFKVGDIEGLGDEYYELIDGS